MCWLGTEVPGENSEALEIAKPFGRRKLGSQIMGLSIASLPMHETLTGARHLTYHFLKSLRIEGLFVIPARVTCVTYIDYKDDVTLCLRPLPQKPRNWMQLYTF